MLLCLPLFLLASIIISRLSFDSYFYNWIYYSCYCCYLVNWIWELLRFNPSYCCTNFFYPLVLCYGGCPETWPWGVGWPLLVSHSCIMRRPFSLRLIDWFELLFDWLVFTAWGCCTMETPTVPRALLEFTSRLEDFWRVLPEEGFWLLLLGRPMLTDDCREFK